MRSLANSLLGMAVLPMLYCCTANVPYHHFEETAAKGWDKEDTMHFSIDTLRQTGNYTLSLDIRTTNMYPYSNLALEVEETVFRCYAQGTQQPAPEPQLIARRVYPVHFETVTSDGQLIGTGMCQHDLSRLLTCQFLRHGDSIHVKVYHKMRRLVLPGITDIGIKLER